MFDFLKATMRSQEDKCHAEGQTDTKSGSPLRDRIAAAVFYGIVSLAVIFTNKSIMTQHKFPHFDFLATVQFAATSIILGILVLFRKVDIPVISLSICREVLPISVMFLGNVICGLGSTKSLNLPMFTALRRFSIFMTMCAEYFILGNKPSSPIVWSVAMMVGGAVLAAIFDLTYDTEGYVLVFLNNTFTTLNGVWMKKASISGKCSKMGVLFYNSLFSAIFMLLFFTVEHYHVIGTAVGPPAAQHIRIRDPLLAQQMQQQHQFQAALMKANDIHALQKNHADALGTARTLLTFSIGSLFANNEIFDKSGENYNLPNKLRSLTSSDAITATINAAEISHVTAFESKLSSIAKFEGWLQWDFCILFIFAALMGTVLNYSIFLCTTLNSALTTAVVGCLKNVATTYIGVIFLPDYAFNWINFAGLNISIAGSLYYTYVTLWKGMGGYGGG